MTENVIYRENGDLEIDIENDDLLVGRADVNNSPELLDNEGRLGGIAGKAEEKLKNNEKRTGWKEAHKATDVKHVCAVCGTRYWGRPNKGYCSPPCKEVAKKRRLRKRKRDIRDFKPHTGTAGEVYYIKNVNGKDVISFVPAFNAETREKAKDYINKRYPKDTCDDIIQQINKVIPKGVSK